MLVFRTAVDETYANLEHRGVSNFLIQVDSRANGVKIALWENIRSK